MPAEGVRNAANNARPKLRRSSFLVLLAWLSQCDGNIDDNERTLLEEVAGTFLEKQQHVSAFFRILRSMSSRRVGR